MAQQADLLVDRPPAPAAPRRDPVLIVVAGVLSLLLWLAVVVQMVFCLPRFERFFGGFRMQMPSLMELVIHESRWAVPALTVVAFVVCIALGKRSRWAWSFLLILLPFVINLVVGVSLYFPYMELLDGLAGGGKK